MKKIIKSSIIILLCMLVHIEGSKLHSQPQPEFICGTCQEHARQNEVFLQNNSLSKTTIPLGGSRSKIPAKDTLKIFIIFAKFNGDVDPQGY